MRQINLDRRRITPKDVARTDFVLVHKIDLTRPPELHVLTAFVANADRFTDLESNVASLNGGEVQVPATCIRAIAIEIKIGTSVVHLLNADFVVKRLVNSTSGIADFDGCKIELCIDAIKGGREQGVPRRDLDELIADNVRLYRKDGEIGRILALASAEERQ